MTRLTREHRAKLSAAKKGRVHSEAHNQAIRAAVKAWWNRHPEYRVAVRLRGHVNTAEAEQAGQST